MPTTLTTCWTPPHPKECDTWTQGAEESQEDFLDRWAAELALATPANVSRLETTINNDPNPVGTSHQDKDRLIENHKAAVELEL